MLMPGLVMLGSRAAGWVGWARKGKGPGRVRKPSSPAAAMPVFPVNLDVTQLLEAAQVQFIRLQAAWDAGDMVTLGALTTPQMLDDLCAELPCVAGASNQTDVVSLQARLLGFDDFGSAWLATIEFTGMIREEPHRNAAPFRELWLLTRERSAQADDSLSPPGAWRANKPCSESDQTGRHGL